MANRLSAAGSGNALVRPPATPLLIADGLLNPKKTSVSQSGQFAKNSLLFSPGVHLNLNLNLSLDLSRENGVYETGRRWMAVLQYQVEID